ncbi:hypothetical protein FHU38_000670 [Saccharomonospora amisosensis]|uniref:Cytochrome P450 n=1 Tax=Saccharomonospora amisosensis TaxID=1128677 RepID=A0A7X5ULQ2_9PSEU|nr:hypothetical protein [Saccharomonospora amisosensis]NIJ10326.1 hypothetical protein [Saccharomonospora amisosensis]
MLTVTDPARVYAILTDPRYTVPAVADAAGSGVAWLRANVARFATPRRHRRLRALAEAELATVAPGALRSAACAWRGGRTGPVPLLAEALGLPVAAEDVAVVARHYQPHTGVPPGEADNAMSRLAVACRGGYGDGDERTAARIGLLVQAYEPTNLLAERAVRRGGSAPVAEVLAAEAPVRETRRFTPTGEPVVLDLAAAALPFGAGAHACPGWAHAVALAEGMVEGTAQEGEGR